MGAEQRTFANLTVRVEDTLVAVPVSAVPQLRTGASSEGAFKEICPTHGVTLKQRRFCTADDHEVTEVAKGRVVGDRIVPATKEEIVEIRTGNMAKGELNLSPIHADQVDAVAIPAGGGYRLRPPSKATDRDVKGYRLLQQMIDRPEIAWLGWLNLKDSRKFYRAQVWNDQIMLFELYQPADIAPPDDIDDAEFSDRELAMGDALIEALLRDFDPDEFHYDVAAAAAAFVASKEGVSVVEPAAVAAEPASDVLAMLEASLAAGKLKNRPRTPRKAAPRKRTAATRKKEQADV